MPRPTPTTIATALFTQWWVVADAAVEPATRLHSQYLLQLAETTFLALEWRQSRQTEASSSRSLV